ncbi:MAG TPA: VOC family protein [Bacteroidales bacterium]|nr:VOC family protein [Bacteroidales bacterium]
MKKEIYPCLWLDGTAREAAGFYASVFGESEIESDNGLVVMLRMSNQRFMLLNGGPLFKINPSVSFYTSLPDINEIERVWTLLVNGGSVLMPLDIYPWSKKYGWVIDRYGVSWQLTTGSIQEPDRKFVPALMLTGAMNGKARMAVEFYTSLFSNSSVKFLAGYEEGEGDVVGNIKHGQFRLNDQTFAIMESSLTQNFTFNEGISFVIECDTQEEIDFLWNSFTKEGKESMCGWLRDPFGVSWQIIPSVLSSLMSDPDRSKRVVAAFMKMKKFDIETILKA